VAPMLRGDEVMKYGIGDWPEKYGNHRAVVTVDAAAEAVWVHLPWRRRDASPERKAVWVVAAANDERVQNVVCPTVSREVGDVVFEPVAGAGTYYPREGWEHTEVEVRGTSPAGVQQT